MATGRFSGCVLLALLVTSTAAFALSLLLLAIGAGIESCLKARVSHPL